MRFVLAILVVLVLCTCVQAQQVYQPAPYVIQPPAYVVQPAPILVQPAVPMVPYIYRQRYWTPVRDFLFGRYRTGLAPLY